MNVEDVLRQPQVFDRGMLVECNVFDVEVAISVCYPTIAFAMLTPLWG
ncbi:MAG: hypothetical protein RRY02_05675 [Muribaculaceae bacterium]